MSTTIRTPDQRVRVFISSTIQELADERKAAREAIERLHLIPVFFEAGARPHPPRDLYRAYLEQSHIFVGIYWNRYGWVAPEMEISGLEDEYVLSKDKPRLIYVKHSTVGREPRLTDLLGQIERGGTACYQKFSTPEELRDLLANDLALMLSENFQLSDEVKVSSVPAKRNPLPVFQGTLIGRENDINATIALLTHPDVPLVTLTGSGGTGKTSLGIYIANQLKEQFRDGVYYVPLATVTNPNSLIPSIAEHIGLFDSGKQLLRESVLHFLYDKQILLVLDNFEQIVSAAPDLAELMHHCKHLKMLVTSRSPLHIRGEINYPIQPLAVPVDHPDQNQDDILNSPAVELFIRRAKEGNPLFTADKHNLDAIARICRKLDGIPLAIELAAARTRLLSPVALLGRMEKMLDTLTSGQRDLPERQRTLRATIDWSHDLLDDACKALFKRLAVFNGTWTLDAAEHVINWESTNLLDAFEKLIDLGLVQCTYSEEEAIFSVFETIREYAGELLQKSGEEDRLRAKHLEYYIGFVEAAYQYAWTPRRSEWFDKIDLAFQNIREACYRAVRRGDYQSGWRIFHALGFYWATNGKITEAIQWIDIAKVTSDHSRLDGIIKDIDPIIQAGALRASGVVHFLTSSFQPAVADLKESIRLYLENGQELEAGRAMSYCGVAGISAGDLQSSQYFHRALEIGQQYHDSFNIVISSAFLSEVLAATGDIEGARKLVANAIHISKQINDSLLAALSLGQSANIEIFTGNYTHAEAVYAESLDYARYTPLGSMKGWFEIGTAVCMFMRNDYTGAVKYFTSGLSSGRSVGDKAVILSGFLGFSFLALAEGKFERAARLYGAAESLLRLSGHTLWNVSRNMFKELTEKMDALPDQALILQAKEAGENYSLDVAIVYALTGSTPDGIHR